MTNNKEQTEFKVKKPRRLTIKQKKFVENYIKTGNGTESAKKAGYSQKTAYSISNENLNKPEIKTELSIRTAQIEQNTNVTIESIRQEHAYYQKLALEKGDLSNATANLIAKGRTVAAYSDNLNTTDVVRAQEAAKCSEAEAIELKRLANIRLSEMKQVKEG